MPLCHAFLGGNGQQFSLSMYLAHFSEAAKGLREDTNEKWVSSHMSSKSEEHGWAAQGWDPDSCKKGAAHESCSKTRGLSYHAAVKNLTDAIHYRSGHFSFWAAGQGISVIHWPKRAEVGPQLHEFTLQHSVSIIFPT